jgi:acyl-coenzyme A thioesterase PaaI-like protein
VFSRGIGWKAPYSGTIRPQVAELDPGRAVIRMADRRRVRNHLRSIHAAALMNLCELTGGLLSLVSIPPGARMIVTGFEIEFLKKARGWLTSTGTCAVPERTDHGDLVVAVSVRDEAGDEVCRAKVRTLVGPIPKKP